MNNSITATLRALTADTERLLAERLRPTGLTVPQLQFLTVLADNPNLCGAGAAEAAHVTPQTASTVLNNLAAKRLITARRVPGKGRRHKLTVTARGKETLGHALEAVADVEKQLAEMLGEQAVSRLSGTVTALQPHLPQHATKPKAKTSPKRSNAGADKDEQLLQRCREWAATVGGTEFVPGYVALQFGTQEQLDRLVAAGALELDGNGYRITD